MTIYRKMLLGFGIIIVLLLAVNGITLFRLAEFSTTIRSMLTTDVRAIDVIRQIRSLLLEEERHAQKLLVSGDLLYASLFREVADSASALLETSLPRVIRGTEQAEVARITRLHEEFREEVDHRRVKDDRGTPQPLTDEHIGASIAELETRLDVLTGRTRYVISTSMSELESTSDRFFRFGLLLAAVALASTLITAFLITRSITNPLDALREATSRVAEGNFRPIAVTSHDELGDVAQAFNEMNARLQRSQELRTETLQQISHEIRTPLQSMYAAYYLLSRGIPGPINQEQLKLVDGIKGNVDRIAEFSNQFLDLAKIEAGMMRFTLTDVQLASAIAPAVENARTSATDRGITILETGEASPPVRADAEKVHQVAANYLSNAVKFTPSGGVITVDVRPSDLGVRLTVTDTGYGIPPEDLPKMFTKFFQAKNTGQSGVKGTGIGLALVKALVEQQGGRVGVSSTLGSGSSFTADFPAVESREGEHEKA